MAISRTTAACVLIGACAFATGVVHGREAATPAACQAAGTMPPIAAAREAAARNVKDLHLQFQLADAWSDAGCFNDAVQALVVADRANPGSSEIETRLRVARSVVGEEHFFDNLDRAEDEARLKRAMFRCTSLADAQSCTAALRERPDDASLWVSQGDALMRADRPHDALEAYRHAAGLAPDEADIAGKISAARSRDNAGPTQLAEVAGPAVKTHLPAPTVHPPATRLAAAAHRAPALASAPPPSSASNSNLEPESRSR